MTKHFLALLMISSLALAGCGDRAVSNEHNHAAASTQENTEARQYTCPMHPHYVSTDPDGNCPICGMDLVPLDTGSPSTTATASAVAVAAEMIQTMGIRTQPVTRVAFGRTLRAFGTVQSDTRLEAVSVSRLEGWIENLTIRAEGDTVRPGALLYNVYSPALIAAQKDYITSLKIGNENRLASVRQRLESLGMQNAVIRHLTTQKKVIERVPVYAEAGGTVLKLEVRDGTYVKPGTPILRVQSFADVWVIAAIPEQDLSFIETGMPVALIFPSAPDAPTEGHVDYIYPTIDPKTRTANVRIEVDNSEGYLRPGAYADISFQSVGVARISVPTEAVLRGSDGAHVIVALGEGRFESRRIQTGIAASGRTEVITGLSEKESVVASGQFLLDSEVNLREGFAKLSGPTPLAGTFDTTTALADLPVDATTLAQIDHLVDAALYFHEALTDKYAIDPFFLDPTLTLIESLEPRFSGSSLSPILANGKAALAAAKVSKSRESLAHNLSDLMTTLEPWLLEGAPSHYNDKGLVLFRDVATGRLWLQEEDTPVNPYGDAGSEPLPWPDPMAVMGNKE